MQKGKKTSIVGIIITIILLISLVFLSNVDIKNLSKIQNPFNSIVMFVQNELTYLKNKIAGNDSFFANLDILKEENEALKAEKVELEKKLRELEIIKAENDTLREYFNLTEQYSSYNTVPCYVINKDISNYNEVLVINVGSDNGVDVNMTVISEKGLVGHIISVTNKTAKVQLITDTSSVVSAKISTSDESIICKGVLEGNSTLKATYIPVDDNLMQGDSVETSGMGGLYPKGIYIGKIKEVVTTQNIIDRYAIVETAVDFEKLYTALVIK